MKDKLKTRRREGKRLDDDTETFYCIGLWVLPVLLVIIGVMLIWGNTITTSGSECAFYRVVGVYCPGCGGTRALNSLVHMNIGRSFMQNPFVPYSFFIYIFFMINTVMRKYTRLFLWKNMKIMPFIYVGVGILLGQWVIRNIFWIGFRITCL